MGARFLDSEPHAEPSDCDAVGEQQDETEDAEDSPEQPVLCWYKSSRADPGKEKNFDAKQCEEWRAK